MVSCNHFQEHTLPNTYKIFVETFLCTMYRISPSLYQDTSEMRTPINRTLSSVPNATFVYLTTSEIRTPHYSGYCLICPNIVPIIKIYMSIHYCGCFQRANYPLNLYHTCVYIHTCMYIQSHLIIDRGMSVRLSKFEECVNILTTNPHQIV